MQEAKSPKVNLNRRKKNSKTKDNLELYISNTVNQNFENAIQHVTERLKDEGFGVLTEIDVKETLKKKLDVDSRSTKFWGLVIQTLRIKPF